MYVEFYFFLWMRGQPEELNLARSKLVKQVQQPQLLHTTPCTTEVPRRLGQAALFTCLPHPLDFELFEDKEGLNTLEIPMAVARGLKQIPVIMDKRITE